MKLLRYIIPHLSSIKVRLGVHVFLLIVSMALSIVNPILVGRYIDVLSTTLTMEGLITFVLLLACSWMLGAVVSYISSINGAHMNVRVMYSINLGLLQHTERLPYSVLSQMDTVYLNNRIHNDSAVVTSYFLDSVLGTLFNLLTTIVVIALLIYIDPLIGCLILLMLPVYMLVYILFRKRIERRSHEVMESRDTFFSAMNRQLSHTRTIKLNAWYERLYQQLMDNFHSVYHFSIRNIQINTLYGTFNKVIQAVAEILIFLLCGISVIRGTMPLGNLIIMNSLFSLLFSSFSSLFNFGKVHANAMASYGRIRELETMEEEKYGNLLPKNVGKIAVEHLSFSYPNDKRKILDGASLEFEVGKIYQLKGENGCGKSTLINLILGLYPDNDRISFNGVPLNEIDMYHFRQELVSIVEQEPPLIFTTTAENITDQALSKQELLQKIKSFGLEDLIGSFDFLDNRQVSDNFINLSGGEKQKVAILRALLKNSKVVVLDEPTSALDARSCKALGRILEKLKSDKIIIMVAHQAILSDIVDVVYEFDNGRVTQR